MGLSPLKICVYVTEDGTAADFLRTRHTLPASHKKDFALGICAPVFCQLHLALAPHAIAAIARDFDLDDSPARFAAKVKVAEYLRTNAVSFHNYSL
jgi:hypothetical protein